LHTMRVALLVLIFAIAAFAQTATENEVKTRIDTFETDTPTIIILIPTGGASGAGLTSSQYVSGAGILGNERDLTLIVESGDQNLVLTTGVSDRVYTAATPNGARGVSILTLDGVDGSPNINYNGLGGADFTTGDAFAFITQIQSDQPTTITFDVYSGSSNNNCQFDLDVPGDDLTHEYIINFSQFSGGCSFSSVGAFEITIAMFDNVDVLIGEVDTYGPVDTCICNCPVFSCRIYYDQDDDTFSYFRTSQFGVFNPTTDFSTVNGPPPPNPTPSRTPSRRPNTNSDSSTTLTNSVPQTNSNNNSNSNNNNDNESNNNSSASAIAVSLATIALFVALLF